MKLQIKMWVAVVTTTIIYAFLIPDSILALIIPLITFVISIINKFITKITILSPIHAWYKGFVIVNILLIITIVTSVTLEKGFDVTVALTTTLGLGLILIVIYILVKIIDKNISDS